MSRRICDVILQAPSSSIFLHVSTKHPEVKWTIMPVPRTSSSSSFIGFQASQGGCFGSDISKKLSKCHSLTLRSTHNYKSWTKSCLDISFRSRKLNMQLLAPRQSSIQRSQRFASAGLCIGLVCCSSSEPVHADAPEAKEYKEVSYSHGKRVYTDYSVTGELHIRGFQFFCFLFASFLFFWNFSVEVQIRGWVGRT